MPSLAALSVPTWQSLMTQRLNFPPSWRNSAGCAAAPITGVAKLAAAAVSSVRRVGDVSSSMALSPLRSTPRVDEVEAMLALPCAPVAWGQHHAHDFR